jgi:hypothetical protein
MLVANIAYLCLGVYKLLSCATHALSLADPPAEAHGKRYRTRGRTMQAELAVTSCTPRASVDRTWYKTFQQRSAPDALVLPLSSGSCRFEFYLSESAPWTRKKLRYLTLRYITCPIVVATIGAKGLLPSLIATLHGCSCSSTILSGSIYLWHIGYFSVHAAQRSKADEQIVYTRASLDACT